MRKIIRLLAFISVLLFIVICVVLITVWNTTGFDSGNEWLPTWSSDQQNIAFECMFIKLSDLINWDVGSQYYLSDICILNRGDNKLTRLTTEHGVSAPSWSPNGFMLAWLQGDGIAIWNKLTNQFENFQSPRQFDFFDFQDDGRLEWSQDNRRIFVQGDGISFDVQQKIFVDQLPTNRSPEKCCFSWSPDGRYLAYKSMTHEDANGGHWQVVIMQNGQISYKSDLEADLDVPLHWSPSGSILAWVSSLQYHQIRLVFTDGMTGKTKLLFYGDDAIGISGIAWSPEGNQLAVAQGDQLQILNFRSVAGLEPDVTIQKSNIPLKGFPDIGIAWSPDEKFVAYDTGFLEDSHIWILNLGDNVQT